MENIQRGRGGNTLEIRRDAETLACKERVEDSMSNDPALKKTFVPRLLEALGRRVGP